MKQRSRLARSQRKTIALGILCVVALIVILQLWLFTASMNAYLGGKLSVLAPAALASLGCLGLAGGLYRYLKNLDR